MESQIEEFEMNGLGVRFTSDITLPGGTENV